MKITRFWIVTKPNALSTIDDICFETDVIALEKQFKGGLRAEDIVSIYSNQIDAWGEAKLLLSSLKHADFETTERWIKG